MALEAGRPDILGHLGQANGREALAILAGDGSPQARAPATLLAARFPSLPVQPAQVIVALMAALVGRPRARPT
ncbi:MAG: hypothetical protein LBP92_00960 [Deltaproteobacteria bacterium]|nr:hypothetical protein [Deltaproteobacteria bacterium]